MHVRALVVLAALASLASASALAAPPAAPVVTVGAENRQLIFDWDPVPGALGYQLVYKMDSHSSFSNVGGPVPPGQYTFRANISVHRLNWWQARFAVAACNNSGCTNSAEISVQGLMLDAIGYFKASNTDADDQFGRGFALSADGKTLVIGAQNEDSGATGVNGNQADNSVPEAGAVYVFRRGSSGWRQEAYLKADVVNTGQYFGIGWPVDFSAIGVSANGNLIALGAASDTVNGFAHVGAVYIFGRSSTGTWTQLQKLRTPGAIDRDFLYYGEAVDLTDDGNTLRVLEMREKDGEGNRQGEHHIYVRSSGGAFVHQTTLTIPHNEIDFCSSGKLSGDGQTFVQYCISYGPEKSRIVTWKRSSAGWTKLPAVVLVSNYRTEEFALSFAGERLAFSDSSHPFSSNVRVFSWSGTAWVQDAVLETPAGVDTGYSTWGKTLAFNHPGTLLAISDYYGAAGGRGVSDSIQTTGPLGGAVFLYARTSSTTNRWAFRKQVKAPNADDGDGFGWRMAFCGTGNALAIGAIWESSAAKGIDGDQSDNSAPQAGAVYLY